MYIPNPYNDPAFAAYMAFMYPYQPYLLLPTFAVAAASVARASLLVPTCAATAWNLAILGLLAGEGTAPEGRPCGVSHWARRSDAEGFESGGMKQLGDCHEPIG